MRHGVFGMDQLEDLVRIHLVERIGAFERRFGRTSFGHPFRFGPMSRN